VIGQRKELLSRSGAHIILRAVLALMLSSGMSWDMYLGWLIPVPTPTNLHEYQKKGLTEKAIRN